MPAAAATTQTLEAAAALLGKKTDTLKKWFAQGCPHVKGAKGYSVDIAAVFDWRIEREKSLAQGGDGTRALSVEVSRARLLDAQLEQQEMENRRRRGELVEAKEVEREWGEIMDTIRGKLLPLGSKVGSLVGGVAGRRVKGIIDDLIKKALEALATDKPDDD